MIMEILGVSFFVYLIFGLLYKRKTVRRVWKKYYNIGKKVRDEDD